MRTRVRETELEIPDDVKARLKEELKHPRKFRIWEVWEDRIILENMDLLAVKQLYRILGSDRHSYDALVKHIEALRNKKRFEGK